MAQELTDTDFKTTIESSDKPVLVDFWAVWCGPCRHQGMILDKWAEANGENVMLAKVNVDQASAIAAQFGISSIPTLILFSKGNEVARAVGVQRESDLDGILAKAE